MDLQGKQSDDTQSHSIPMLSFTFVPESYMPIFGRFQGIVVPATCDQAGGF